MFAELSVMQIRLGEYMNLIKIAGWRGLASLPIAGMWKSRWRHRHILPKFAKVIVIQIRLSEYTNLKRYRA